MTKCRFCNNEMNPILKVVKEVFNIRKVKINADIKEMTCSVCGEYIYNEEIDRYNQSVVFEQYKKEVGLITGQQIVEFRNDLVISQKTLSKILNISEKTLTRYENGKIQEIQHDKLLRNAILDINFFSHLYNDVKDYLNNKDIISIDLYINKRFVDRFNRISQLDEKVYKTHLSNASFSTINFENPFIVKSTSIFNNFII